MRLEAEMAQGTQVAVKRNHRPCAAAVPHEEFLRQLGERVRNARARRGMTRRALAQDSSVSERYLAQLETGQGNISIILLRQIAYAMNMSLADIVREGDEPPIELSLIDEYLRRLQPGQLSEARELLIQRFGTVRERHGRIALIGLRGAGKTTVGHLLADHLNIPFIELTGQVETDVGMKTDEIFSLSGQAAYRRYERRSLERVIDQHPKAVIVTGGGSVSDPATYEMLLSACLTVWLKATPEEHMRRVIAQGDSRPMAGNPEAMEDLRRILRSREGLYAKADVTVDTTRLSPLQVKEELLTRIGGDTVMTQHAN